MGRKNRCWYALLMLLLLPRSASAIQLHWNDGTAALTFTEATRCTLVVQADSIEQRLPAEWRLLWVADSTTQISPVPLGDPTACVEPFAQVSAVDQPANAADSAAHLLTAHFCSSENGPVATEARFLLDLPAGGAGRLKVVALDPNDSTQAIESGEVTFNNWVSGDYPPVVLHAYSEHQSLRLKVTAVGTGLNTTDALSLVAADSAWTLPLTLIARSDETVTATADVASPLPASQVRVASSDGSSVSAMLPADDEVAPLSTEGGGCTAQYWESNTIDPPPNHGYTIQPKDFAFTAGYVDTNSSVFALHFFYIRHNYWYDAFWDQNGHFHPAQPDSNEKDFGHAWASSLFPWIGETPSTRAVHVRPGEFDELHVWAPSIVKLGPTYLMFYTGVRNEGGRQNQRIGVAHSTDLNNWTPDSVVIRVEDVGWASKNPRWFPYYGSQQLRDPFVMEDPKNQGKWLMFFVSLDSLNSSSDTTVQLRMAVGVARSSDLRSWDVLPKPFCSTERTTDTGDTTKVVESPHVFLHDGQWWMPYTVNNNHVYYQKLISPFGSPADTIADDWAGPFNLQKTSKGQPEPLSYWHATEHLGGGSYEYLAAWNDNASSIEIMGILPKDSTSGDSLVLGCPLGVPPAGVEDANGARRELRMAVTRLRWGNPEVDLRLEIPSRMALRLAVYDVAGRKRATLVDRELPAGDLRLNWDCRDDTGSRIASGVYFLRLTCPLGKRVSKLVVIR